MVTPWVRVLRIYAEILKLQIEAGVEGQEETVGRMEEVLRIIRNKKNRGRGEAAGQETPPTAVGEWKYKFRAAPSDLSHKEVHPCRIVTENGPHRSRFEGDSDG
jgi:hypothetical protein